MRSRFALTLGSTGIHDLAKDKSAPMGRYKLPLIGAIAYTGCITAFYLDRIVGGLVNAYPKRSKIQSRR